MTDITKYDEVVKTINAIINNGGTAEVKLESNQSFLVVAESNRRLKTKTKIKDD